MGRWLLLRDRHVVGGEGLAQREGGARIAEVVLDTGKPGRVLEALCLRHRPHRGCRLRPRGMAEEPAHRSPACEVRRHLRHQLLGREQGIAGSPFPSLAGAVSHAMSGGATRTGQRGRRQNMLTAAMVAPLVLFIVVVFLWPVARFLALSVDNSDISSNLSRTFAQLDGWQPAAG